MLNRQMTAITFFLSIALSQFSISGLSFAQIVSEAEIQRLIQEINWNNVTFGFEAEARDEGTGRTDVIKMKTELLAGRGPKLPGANTTYIEASSREATGNLEFKSKVLSRSEVYKAMRDIRSRLGKGSRPGVRGFHLHARFPETELGNMPEHQFRALLSRFGDAVMGVRLQDYLPFYALSTGTVGRADALTWDGGRAIMRYQKIGDQWDVEFRGFVRSLREMENIVDRFFVTVQNEELRNGFYASQVIVATPPNTLIGAINQWAEKNNRELVDVQRLYERIELIKNSYRMNSKHLLPLISFEALPWLSEEKRTKLIEARKKFLKKAYELLMNDKPPKDRFRNLIKAWAREVGFENFTKEQLVLRNPPGGKWPNESLTPALVKYLVADHSAVEEELRWFRFNFTSDPFVNSKKELARQFDVQHLGEVARGILSRTQAQDVAMMLDERGQRQKFVAAIGENFAPDCEALTPYLY